MNEHTDPRARADAADAFDVPRRRRRPIALVAQALGGPVQIAGKLERVRRTVATAFDLVELDRRLTELERCGLIAHRPTPLQLAFGSLDMLRFLIVPFAADYYAMRGISFRFHQLLRFLDDPASMMDPSGFLSDRDTIIGHLMQVVHLNPVYDVQLLSMFPDGLDELEAQIESILAGTHPRAATIGAVVEDAGYHGRLLEYLRRYRDDPSAEPPVREQRIRHDPHLLAAEETFATLPGYVAYCHRLPRSPTALVRRHRSLTRFPLNGV